MKLLNTKFNRNFSNGLSAVTAVAGSVVGTVGLVELFYKVAEVIPFVDLADQANVFYNSLPVIQNGDWKEVGVLLGTAAVCGLVSKASKYYNEVIQDHVRIDKDSFPTYKSVNF